MPASQDVLEVSRAISAEENSAAQNMLDHVVAMLTKPGRRGYTVQEGPASYGTRFDSDSDTNPDSDPSRVGQHNDAAGV